MSDASNPSSTQSLPTILIADSCSGGFGVLSKVLPWAGGFRVVYLADSAFNPFGLKSKDALRGIVHSWFQFAQDSDIRPSAVVIACNTASVAVADESEALAQRYGLPVITMLDGLERLLQDPSAKLQRRAVGVLATEFTIAQGYVQARVRQHGAREVVGLAATVSEAAVAHARILTQAGVDEVRAELRALGPRDLEAIVLACTCLEFIEPQVREVFGGGVALLNPAAYVAEAARVSLGVKQGIRLPISEVTMLNTGAPAWAEKMRALAGHIFGAAIQVDQVAMKRMAPSPTTE
jgi:glutamate racemase